MANIQPIQPKPPTSGAPTEAGASLPGGLGWASGKLEHMGDKYTHGMINFLAEIQAMAELLKKEDAVNQAAEQFKEACSASPQDVKAEKAAAKAWLKAVIALKDYATKGYKKIGANLSPKVQADIEAEIEAQAIGTKKHPKSFLGALSHLGVTDKKKFDAALKAWFSGKMSDKDFSHYFEKFTHLMTQKDASADEGFKDYSEEMQVVTSRSTMVNRVLSGYESLEQSDFQTVMKGASQVVQKLFTTIKQMLEITSSR